MYVPYTLQISRFCGLMRLARKTKKLSGMVANFQQGCAAKGLPSFDLESMVSLPYTHLHVMSEQLQTIVASTPQDDAGLEAINKAADRLSLVLDMVDEAKRESEQIKILMKMKEDLPEVSDLLDGAREFIFNGTVTLKSMEVKRKDKNTFGLQVGQQYTAYLFSDIIIFATLKKKLIARVSLNDVSIAIAVTASPTLVLPQKHSKTLLLSLVCMENLYSFSTSCTPIWTKTLSEAIEKRRRTQMFGVTLNDIMERPSEASEKVPRAIETIITYISDHGLLTDGIFRKAGSFPEITRYKNRMDAGKMIYFTDPLTAAAVLKTWLHELADPLLTSALYTDWLCVGDSQTRLDSCLARLPTQNINLLAEIMKLSLAVTAKARYNKMTVENLAVVLGPVMLFDTSAQVDLSKCSQTITLFVTLVKNAEKIIAVANDRAAKKQKKKVKLNANVITLKVSLKEEEKKHIPAPKSARGIRKCSLATTEPVFIPERRSGTPTTAFDLSKSEETSEDSEVFK